MRLNLSQNLTVPSQNDPSLQHYTISVEGECDKSCGSCDEYGANHSWPCDGTWLVLTNKAFDVWKGDIKEEVGYFWGELRNDQN